MVSSYKILDCATLENSEKDLEIFARNEISFPSMHGN